MILTLQNSDYRLSINPQLANWSLVEQHHENLALKNVRMGIFYRTRRNQFTALNPGSSLSLQDQKTVASLHGPLRQVEMVSQADRNGLAVRLFFALAEKAPLMLMKMQVENQGKAALFMDRIEFMNAGFVYISHASLPVMKYAGYRQASGVPLGSVVLSDEMGDLGFFSNGWQSWNYTGVYGISDHYRRTRLGPFTSPMRINSGTPHHKRANLFASDMFAVLGDRINRKAILTGFLSQREQFGSIEALLDPFAPALRVWANADGIRLDPGSIIATDWLCLHFLHLDTPDPLGPYLDAVARENQIQLKSSVGVASPNNGEILAAQLDQTLIKLKDSPAGWCSWYHYFQRVRAEDIRKNLAAAQKLKDRIPLELIQIDDGYEAQIGDWLEFSPAFPDGVAALAKEIDQAGFSPGIWLAPYIVHPKSNLAREHPDWILRNKLGIPMNAGFIWDTFTTGLDLTQPGAMEYTCQVVQVAAQEWGYPYLKLDFLYAAALPGRFHDPTRTRAQVLRKGLENIRAAVGDQIFILGCGCPLGSALGLVDAMRIGSDVDVRWRPEYKGIRYFFSAEPDMPSARNAIQNSLTRAPLHQRWWINDPDCLLLRPDTELTLAELQSLATVISLSGGSLLLSDDLTNLPAERLKIAEALMPLIGKAPYLLDWFDSPTPARLQLNLDGALGKWHLIGLFNWSDRPANIVFHLNDFYLDPSGHYLVHSFWENQPFIFPSANAQAEGLVFKDVPAHGVVMLSVRKYIPSLPGYIGSNLHISQGLEVRSWQWFAGSKLAPDKSVTGTLSFCLVRPGFAKGKISLYLPGNPIQAMSNGVLINWELSDQNTYCLNVEFQKSAEIEIII